MAKGTCSVEDCEEPHKGHGWCSKHWQRWRRLGRLDLPSTDERIRAKEVGYGRVHQRIIEQRGSASNYPCQHCEGAATQWAYDHSDPNELRNDTHPYSLDTNRYIPLCSRCHNHFDLPTRRKLSDEQVAEIRRRYAAGGVSHRALAHEYGVRHPHIGRIIRGKARPDPEGPIP